jgi:hypothetical protein
MQAAAVAALTLAARQAQAALVAAVPGQFHQQQQRLELPIRAVVEAVARRLLQ